MSLEQFIQQFSQSLAQGSALSLLIAAGAGMITTGVCPCTLPVGLGIAGLVSCNTENKSNKGFMPSSIRSRVTRARSLHRAT